MEEDGFPSWIRAVDAIVGIISIVAAVLFVIGSSLSNFVLIFVLSASLVAVAFARVARAAAVKAKGTPRRAVNLITGVGVLILVAIVFFVSGLTADFQIRLIASAWLIMGIARILIGILENDVQRNLRISQFVIGIVSIAISIYIDLNPSIDIPTAVVFLALVVGSNGLARTARGYVGV